MSKPTTPAVAPGHGQLGDLARRAPGAASRSAAGVRRSGRRPPAIPWPRSPSLHRLDDLVEGQPGARRAARGRSGPRRRPRRPRRGPRRTRGPPGRAPPGSASPRRCGRRSRGSAPATRSRPTRRTTAPSASASPAGSSCPTSVGELERSSAAAARRRGGRAAAPWAPGGSARGTRSGRFGHGRIHRRPAPSQPVADARSRHARLRRPRRAGRRRRRGRSAPATGSRSTRTGSTAFADATGDHQWIHVDVERATAGPFGGTIAHGYLTLSLMPALGSPGVRARDPGAKLNYGVNKVRFPNPVQVGSRIRGHVTVAEVTDVPAGKQLTLRLHDRDRGRGQAGLRRRDRRPAAA